MGATTSGVGHMFGSECLLKDMTRERVRDGRAEIGQDGWVSVGGSE